MKREVSLISCFLIFISCFSLAQEWESITNSVELSQFITCSGYTSSTGISYKIDLEKKRNLTLGVFYDIEYKRISGISAHHEVVVWYDKFRRHEGINLHLFYNLMFRQTKTSKSQSEVKSNIEPIKYISIEHHIGLGTKIEITDDLYLDCDAGVGLYLGSVKKPSGYDPYTGKIKGGKGLSLMAKLSIGYDIF